MSAANAALAPLLGVGRQHGGKRERGAIATVVRLFLDDRAEFWKLVPEVPDVLPT